jgi:hypothetical protein
MLIFALYLALFLPAVYATSRLRELRKAKRGYKRFMLLCWLALFLLGFVMAPAAGLGMLMLLAVAGKHTVSELRYRNRQVQYLRGNGPRPAVPGRSA